MQYKVLEFNKKLTFNKNEIYTMILLYLQQNQYFMELSPSKLNSFLFFKLPSAFWSGVRVKSISDSKCVVTVRHKWFNQNPFKSMYFAVQAMAAELTTGALMMMKIKQSGITFTCNDGHLIDDAIQKAIATGEGQTIWMKSIGVNTNGEQVSEMEFEWTIKVKK